MNALETHDLTIGYKLPHRQKHVIASGLGLYLAQGELTCLIGPNGVGKSTLMRTLAGMQPALSGNVLLQGESINNLPPLQLARHLSVVLTERPDMGLFTGLDVIGLGRHPHTGWIGRLSERDHAVIEWAVAAVGAADIAELTFDRMSDGQRQKIMIARALAQEPAVLLLDEPTAFLDLPHRVEVMQLLRKLTRQVGCAVLLSTHDLDLALRTADRMWLMSPNDHIQTGAPEDLILQGAFETVFHNKGVHFDSQTGEFTIANDSSLRTVCLAGNGLRKSWTKRALERAGFGVTDNAPCENHNIVVRVSEMHWLVEAGEAEVKLASIYNLINFLSELD